MRVRHDTLALVVALVFALAAGGCGRGKVAPPALAVPALPAVPAVAVAVPTPVTIAASADTNPDMNGRSSPVVVRVYQLRADAAFNGADFFPLFDDDKKELGAELIWRDEFVLSPGERRTLTLPVAGDARFVGAIAAFRDIRNAQWRVLVPAGPSPLMFAVERARIVLSVGVN